LPLAFGLEVFLGLGFWGLWLNSSALGFLVWEAFGKELLKGRELQGNF
jgi:hypothetical protein